MSIRKTPAGRFELALKHKLLPKVLYFTFDDEGAAIEYKAEALKWLAAGVVPGALRPTEAPGRAQGERLPLTRLMLLWRNTGKPSKTDDDLLKWLADDTIIKVTNTDGLTYAWCERWVTHLKLERTMAPSSIRQRVQALSRAIDWFLRSHPDSNFVNPFKLLPRGYAVYSENEAQALEAEGKEARHDISRERRLHDGEEAAILAALAGVKNPNKQRTIMAKDSEALRALFLFILYTGVRLREAYTVRRENINLKGKVVRIQTTKQRNGKIVFRDVPMRPELFEVLKDTPAEPGLLFQFWNGEKTDLAPTSNRLSNRFRSLFDYVGATDLNEHDLRHEATCRWFELRDSSGGWMFRPEEINRIMGWAPNSTMAARYASFRVESLASRMWG